MPPQSRANSTLGEQGHIRIGRQFIERVAGIPSPSRVRRCLTLARAIEAEDISRRCRESTACRKHPVYQRALVGAHRAQFASAPTCEQRLRQNPAMDAFAIGIFLALILCVGVAWWATAIARALFRRNQARDDPGTRVDAAAAAGTRDEADEPARHRIELVRGGRRSSVL